MDLPVGLRTCSLKDPDGCIAVNSTDKHGRVRSLRKFIDFLTTTFEVSEPCTRCGLKNTNRALGFLEEVTGTEIAARVTKTPIYQIVTKELLYSAVAGQTLMQARRVFVSMIPALETLVIDAQTPMYLRLYSWWMFLQCWCTLRFSDHRGINPTSVVSGSSLSAKLTWSKTIGADKSVASRPLIIDPCCYVVHQTWLQTGWDLLSREAPFDRDFKLPGPAAALSSCSKAELRYHAAHTVQGKVMGILPAFDGIMFTRRVPHYWTPHSGRDFPKTDRDYLGGFGR